MTTEFRMYSDKYEQMFYFDILTCTKGGVKESNTLRSVEGDIVEIESKIVQYYTGSNYPKGRKIYEGDIVLWSGKTSSNLANAIGISEFTHKCEVVWSFEFNGWGVVSFDNEGAIPIGYHGVKPEELIYVGHKYEELI